MGTKQKIFVGMSGGVDSSLSALLLKKKGYDVVGVFIKVWQADFLPCTWREERRDAMRAAASIGIPFITLDLEKEYKEQVVDYMIREYGAGRIPNPDIMCNKYVKFGSFLSYAKNNGGSMIATGHYAQIIQIDNKFHLYTGVDKEKDQSYFLWTLTDSELSSTLFPVGHLEKKEVRRLALKFGLPNAEKKDSQGLCFMGPVDMEQFLKHYLKSADGDVVDELGNVVGVHSGAIFYTIGQRHGFSISTHTPSDKPYFIIRKDIQKNTITVANKNINKQSGLINSFIINEINLHGDCLKNNKDLFVRIRYRGELTTCKLKINNLQGEVSLAKPLFGISEGQSAVFYVGNECIGGGVISSLVK